MFARKRKHLTFKVIFTTLILGIFFLILSPFIVPIVLATLVAFAAEPVLAKMDRPAKAYRKNLVVLAMIACSLIAFVPIGVVGYKIYAKAIQVSQVGFEKSDLYQNAIQYKTTFFNYGNELLNKLGLSSSIHLDEMANQVLSNSGKFLLAGTGYVIGSLPDFFLALFIFFLCLYVFLTRSKTIKQMFLKLDVLEISETNEFLSVLQKTCYTTLFSSLLIGAIQASVVAFGGMTFGSWDFLVVFVLTFFFSFIPVIGAAPVAIVLSALNFAQHANGAAIAMLAVSVVAGFIDNILRPFLVKDEELHPAVALVAIIGAIIVFGISGLFLGPVLANISIKVVPIFFKKKGLFQELDEIHPVVTVELPKSEAPEAPSILSGI